MSSLSNLPQSHLQNLWRISLCRLERILRLSRKQATCAYVVCAEKSATLKLKRNDVNINIKLSIDSIGQASHIFSVPLRHLHLFHQYRFTQFLALLKQVLVFVHHLHQFFPYLHMITSLLLLTYDSSVSLSISVLRYLYTLSYRASPRFSATNLFVYSILCFSGIIALF